MYYAGGLQVIEAALLQQQPTSSPAANLQKQVKRKALALLTSMVQIDSSLVGRVLKSLPRAVLAQLIEDDLLTLEKALVCSSSGSIMLLFSFEFVLYSSTSAS
jgi:hypothetical protein